MKPLHPYQQNLLILFFVILCLAAGWREFKRQESLRLPLPLSREISFRR